MAILTLEKNQQKILLNPNPGGLVAQTILIIRNKIYTYFSIPYPPPLSSKIEVTMNMMTPVNVLVIKPPGLELNRQKKRKMFSEQNMRRKSWKH
jgi:hypothetical protein